MGMHNVVIIPVLFNSLLLLCTADSTGCASRLQKGICRGGSSWQPRALRSPEPRPAAWPRGAAVLPRRGSAESASALCSPAGSRHFFDFRFLTQTRQTGLDAAALQMPGKWPCASGKQSSLGTGLCSQQEVVDWGSGVVQRALLGTPVPCAALAPCKCRQVLVSAL